MANYTNAIWQQAVHTTDQLSFPSCSTTAEKSLYLKEKYWKISGEKNHQDIGPLVEKKRPNEQQDWVEEQEIG